MRWNQIGCGLLCFRFSTPMFQTDCKPITPSKLQKCCGCVEILGKRAPTQQPIPRKGIRVFMSFQKVFLTFPWKVHPRHCQTSRKLHRIHQRSLLYGATFPMDSPSYSRSSHNDRLPAGSPAFLPRKRWGGSIRCVQFRSRKNHSLWVQICS